MRVSTAIMFAVAFVCAGVAALLVRGMVAASHDAGTVTVTRGVPSPTTTIVVAAKDMKAGDALTADNLREKSWPNDTIPKGAFTSKDALLKSGESRTLAAFVAENEPIVPGKLYDSREGSLSGRMRDGMTGVTIRVNDASGVGGFAQPEDRVDILMTQVEAGQNAKAYTVTLLRNVRVLAVDQQTQRKPQAQPPKTVTLEATPEDAKKITLAQAIGQLSLALTRGAKGSGEDGGVIDINDLLLRQPQAPVAPVEPTPVRIDPIVGVTRSTERKEYKVQGEGPR